MNTPWYGLPLPLKVEGVGKQINSTVSNRTQERMSMKPTKNKFLIDYLSASLPLSLVGCDLAGKRLEAAISSKRAVNNLRDSFLTKPFARG